MCPIKFIQMRPGIPHHGSAKAHVEAVRGGGEIVVQLNSLQIQIFFVHCFSV
jgi:hypothetical protein